MNVTLNFFRNNSDKNVLNKNIENGVTLSATLLKDTNIEEPSFLLSSAYNSYYNYLYCEELNKYYFVKPPTIMQGGMRQIDCEEDCLMSNADKIKNLICTVLKNENKSNGYLIDSDFNTLAYEEIVTKKFPHAFTDESVILMTIG